MWRWAVRGGCLRKCAGHQREQLRAHVGTGMGTSGNTTLFGCKPHTARKRVETAGTDSIRARMSSRCTDSGLGLMGARSKRSIGRTIATFYDHLQQIYTIHYISKSFILYGGKLRLHTWIVHIRFTLILSKTTWKQ
jgi:hypothetical protein